MVSSPEKKPSLGPIWEKSAKIELINAQNEVKYTIIPQKRGNLIYFTAEFRSKEPLSEQHYNETGQIYATTDPKIYSGKFGPGVIITRSRITL